jgi:hypothetical protein
MLGCGRRSLLHQAAHAAYPCDYFDVPEYALLPPAYAVAFIAPLLDDISSLSYLIPTGYSKHLGTYDQ